MCFRKSSSIAAVMATTAILVSGCIEQSTVVKVKKDGSGLVHIRMHAQETSIGSFDNGKSHMIDPDVPDKARLDAVARAMGENVRLVTAEASVNRNGWRGFELIYSFDDISSVRLPHTVMSLLTEKKADDAKDAADANETAKKNEKKASEKKAKRDSPIDLDFTFAMKDGQLEVRSNGFAQQSDPAKKIEGAIDPFAAKRSSPLVKLNFSDAIASQIAAQMMTDARLGTFIQIDGEIADSNAIHRNGNVVTLFSVEVADLMKNPTALAMMKSDGQKFSRQKAQAMAGKIKGLNIDAQNPITVLWK